MKPEPYLRQVRSAGAVYDVCSGVGFLSNSFQSQCGSLEGNIDGERRDKGPSQELRNKFFEVGLVKFGHEKWGDCGKLEKLLIDPVRLGRL